MARRLAFLLPRQFPQRDWTVARVREQVLRQVEVPQQVDRRQVDRRQVEVPQQVDFLSGGAAADQYEKACLSYGVYLRGR